MNLVLGTSHAALCGSLVQLEFLTIDADFSCEKPLKGYSESANVNENKKKNIIIKLP